MPAFGDRAALVEGVDRPHRFIALLASHYPQARIRVGLDALLIEFDAPRRDVEEIAALAAGLVKDHQADDRDRGGRSIDVRVAYDGDDLEGAALLLHTSVDDLVARHQQTPWRVAMIGFAPGFPYLVPDDGSDWMLPRLDTPRPRVPAGSVALAAGMSAVYPTAMPGGWHLIGTTEEVFFDPQADPPARLRVGDVVRFIAR
jgi:KipI family sensor histidine kinase inhibitor